MLLAFEYVAAIHAIIHVLLVDNGRLHNAVAREITPDVATVSSKTTELQRHFISPAISPHSPTGRTFSTIPRSCAESNGSTCIETLVPNGAAHAGSVCD